MKRTLLSPIVAMLLLPSASALAQSPTAHDCTLKGQSSAVI